eukprot:NODE_78_length_23230_cov_1.644979.p10 type:complete len:222 gc:universal NODE_78_length_23230_cov_1.644979:15196-15861(+)
MQVLVTLKAKNLSSSRVIMKEIRNIKTMLDKSEQEAKKSLEEFEKWQSEASKLKIGISDLIYGVCVSDIIKELPDKLAEFYKNNSWKFDIPKSLKSKEIDLQWRILYGFDGLKKAQVDFNNYFKDNMDSIRSYLILLLDIIKKYSEQEGIPFSKILVDALVLKKERNLDLHLKLDDNVKDAVDVLNKLENSTLRNIATLIDSTCFFEKSGVLSGYWLESNS